MAQSRHPNAVKEGGNVKSIALLQEMRTWDKINLENPKEIQERINKFFGLMAEYDSKPLVAGLAQALGIDRVELWKITHGVVDQHKCTQISQECKAIITEAYRALEVAFEYNFSNGNINPVTGIFLAKNHFGYTDRQEVVVTPKNILGESEDQALLEERLLASIAQEKK